MAPSAAIPFDAPVNELVLEIFRLNGALIKCGDALVKPLGLSSARWQVLGSVVHGQGSYSVARLADNMGLARQSVQRVVDELAAAGLVAFAPNPAHKRAKLVVMTPRGQEVFERASALWQPVGDALIAGVKPAELRSAIELLAALRERLEQPADAATD